MKQKQVKLKYLTVGGKVFIEEEKLDAVLNEKNRPTLWIRSDQAITPEHALWSQRML